MKKSYGKKQTKFLKILGTIDCLEENQLEIVDRIAENLFNALDDNNGEIDANEICRVLNSEKKMLIKSFNAVRQDICKGKFVITD